MLNLQTQNDALLLKNLHKFFNRMDIPWVQLVWERYYNDGSLPSSTRRQGSFWWKDLLQLVDSFKGLAMANVEDGKSCLFWEDLWLSRVPKVYFPQLFSFAKLTGISIHAACNVTGPDALFRLPLTQEAAMQLLELAQDMNSLSGNNEHDTWSYIWGSPFFSTSKAYKHLTGHLPTHPFFRRLWKTSCQNKHKVFFWLLLRDRLSTRQLLRRRNMHLPSYNCECCSMNIEESLSHLFLSCPFAQSCWIKLNIVLVEIDPYLALEKIQEQLNVPFALDIIILFSWSIWMQ